MIKVEGLKYIGRNVEVMLKSGKTRIVRNYEFKNISEIKAKVMELEYTRSRWEGRDFLPEEEIRFREYIDNKYPAYNFHSEEKESLSYNSAWILKSCTPGTYRNWLCEYYEELIDDLCGDILLLNKTLKEEREKTRKEWELKGFEDQETI